MSKSVCPICLEKTVRPYGYSKDILVIGEFPGKEEIAWGKPFTGNTGQIFRKELAYLGVDLLQVRLTNLWLHIPNKREDCFNYSRDICLEEAKDKKAILLIGSDTVSYFTGYNVTSVNGLQVDSPILSAPIIYAMFNPAITFHKTVGEVRFALKSFVDKLKEENLL